MDSCKFSFGYSVFYKGALSHSFSLLCVWINVVFGAGGMEEGNISSRESDLGRGETKEGKGINLKL